MKDEVLFIIPSHPKYLSVARDMLMNLGRINNVNDATIENLKLAVDEAVSNVMKHAYRGDTGKEITIKYKITDEAFEITIEDTGIKVRSDAIEGRHLDDVRPGGLGVHFIKRACDVFEYDSKKEEGNRLRLVKYLKEK